MYGSFCLWALVLKGAAKHAAPFFIFRGGVIEGLVLALRSIDG